ncbi:MAG TPA: hypothetical protein VG456_02570 [Candidatus Sulfopaludibacter sp.]|jgi:hypothetical protein|nr:hypothetical protein [Candidatus Sulfopaludibacter sp.]
MSTMTDRLYNLLPAVYRVKDAAQGEPLHALLTLIEQQYSALDQDITGLYENWFIETCAEWVVPYIGDLLGVRPLNAASTGTFSARAYVAHTLDYRRRKGTAAMVESMARDVTGWPARVVEYFELLATTQYLNHLRPANTATVNVRRTDELELLGGPFEKIAHTVDVRHISSKRGRYNIPSLGIFLWKLEDYLISSPGDARAVATPADGRYTFDPLGLGSPLCNRPQTQTDNSRLSEEINVPGMLRRLPLHRELESLRQAEVDGAAAPAAAYFGANPVFALTVNQKPVPFDQIAICSIEDVSATDWRRPAAFKSYHPSAGGAAVNEAIELSVDPVRGRIAFPAGIVPTSVEVSYTYAFSGDVGAGPYDRTAWLTGADTGPAPMQNPARWQVAVSKDVAPVANEVFSTLAAAIQAWNAQPSATDGLIAIMDSHSYAEDLTANPILLPDSSRLLIVAADWPSARQSGPPESEAIGPNGVRPHLRGSIAAQGTAPAASVNPGSLYIDGLLIEGSVTINSGNLAAFGLSHSTIAPGGGLNVITSGLGGGDNAGLAVNLYRTICGPIAFNQCQAALNIADSIVSSGPANAPATLAINAPDSTINLQTTTVFGATRCRIVSASDSIFTGLVIAERRQTGCVRFSSLPVGSQTAPRYYCQPDLALKGVAGTAARNAVIARLTPQFVSLDFAQPGFAQLSARCDAGVSAGADNGSEMGAFNFLLQPQRRSNLLTALEEYLRFGVEAGMIEET